MFYFFKIQVSRGMTKPTKWHVRQAKTQISLGIRPVWSESSLSARTNLGSSAAQSDQSLRCPQEQTLGPQLPIGCTAKTLIRLGGCPGWSVSSLGTQPHCWFYHEAAQVCVFIMIIHVSRAKLQVPVARLMVLVKTLFVRMEQPIFTDGRFSEKKKFHDPNSVILHWLIFCNSIVIL